MKKLPILLLITLAFSTLSIKQCSKSDNRQNSTIYISLADNPADYLQLNLDYKATQITTSYKQQTTTTDLDVLKPGMINVLDLQNGRDTLLGNIYAQIDQLKSLTFSIGTNNTLRTTEGDFNLVLSSPDDQTTTIQVDHSIQESDFYNYYIDFNALKSVTLKEGIYYLNPSLRVFSKRNTGIISGNILPVEARPIIKVYVGNSDTLSFLAGENGQFLLRGIKAGFYDVQFKATNGDYKTKVLEEVQVANNDIINIGTVLLDKR